MPNMYTLTHTLAKVYKLKCTVLSIPSVSPNNTQLTIKSTVLNELAECRINKSRPAQVYTSSVHSLVDQNVGFGPVYTDSKRDFGCGNF